MIDIKPTEFCNCICCTDCQYYTDCMENYIVSERAKGKYSFGKLKVSRFPSIDDNGNENLILWKEAHCMTVEELEDDFLNVCSICLDNDVLVNEFCRLNGLKRPDKRSPIEVQIDNACGYDAGMDFMRQFTDFVREFIYIPLLRQQIE